MESATEKQKRLIQAEIAKLSGKLFDLDRSVQLIKQVQFPDMEDPQDRQHTLPTSEIIHTPQEALLREAGVEEEGEGDPTRWIYDKASLHLLRHQQPLRSFLPL
jgi:hypothetical protein